MSSPLRFINIAQLGIIGLLPGMFPGMLLGMISGCANHPSALELAQRYHFSEQTYVSQPFVHQLFFNQAVSTPPPNSNNLLHVYIEGDGSPFLQTTQISSNPTSKDPMMLKLMHIDSNPAIYLGRPCYFRTIDPTCEPLWWTHQRYHEDVIDSMIHTLQQFQSSFDGFVLIGFSGGGALAMLMAETLTDTKMVITLAGNLDTQRWEQHHRYTPMQGSRNPATRIPLPPHIQQIHFAGAKDNNIQAPWINSVAQRQINAVFRLLQDYDHNCCWVNLWPTVLEEIRTTTATNAVQ